MLWTYRKTDCTVNELKLYYFTLMMQIAGYYIPSYTNFTSQDTTNYTQYELHKNNTKQ